VGGGVQPLATRSSGDRQLGGREKRIQCGKAKQTHGKDHIQLGGLVFSHPIASASQKSSVLQHPARVSLIDFKSGDPDSDKHQKLDEEEMQLQVALYAVAAKKELQYQPDQGIVRYLDAEDPSKSELHVPLDDDSLRGAKSTVAHTALKIRERHFIAGPAPRPDGVHRCSLCDFIGFCGMKEAIAFKKSNQRTW
jgi:hypothetical protein